MDKYIVILATLVAVMLQACSGTTSIQRAEDSESSFNPFVYNGRTSELRDDIPESDAYRVFQKGGSGFVTLNSVRAKAENRSTEFCEKKSKVVEVLRETTSVPLHILGNFPRIEIVFACVPPEPSKISLSKSSSSGYDHLRELKSLLDEGAITQEEYNREKNEILRR